MENEHGYLEKTVKILEIFQNEDEGGYRGHYCDRQVAK